MEKSYIETMEHIYPTEEQKSRMFDKIYESEYETVKKQRRVKFRYLAAAAAACMVFSTTIVFAEEIKSTFYNLLGKSEIVSEKVLNDVYSDTDGHVTMTVKEVLSDTINSCVIVEYETHDEEAAKWLDKYTTLRENRSFMINLLKVQPSVKEGTPGPSIGYYWEELKEYRTDNTRVFKAISDANSDEYVIDTIDLEYRLYSKYENHAVINVSNSVELKDIKIDSSPAPDKPYKPLGVKISPMTFFIYGKNCGLYEEGINKYGYYIHSLNDEEIESLYLVMKDGKRHNLLKENDLGLNGGWMLGSAGQFSDADYDVSIYCAYIQNYVDTTDIEGFELDGVYYSLSEYLQ